MLTIIFEYTFNMVVCIHSKYTFININRPAATILIRIHPLYSHRVATKLVTFATNGT
jgi:hypothetical protein